MVPNPFVYGEVVTATAFADREQERERLGRDLAEGQKIFLISPRRYGKSSLIRGVMKTLAAQRVLTVEVTVAASSSYVGFLEAYARALLSADTPPSGLRRWTAELLKSVRPELRFDAQPAGQPRFSVTFPAVPVEHALRAAVQDQRSVGYVFAGSEPSLMERMLTPRRPFYKAGPVVRLGKIDERVFADFIDEKFAGSGIRTQDGLGGAIVELAENVPYDVQRLAHETWDDVRAAGRKSAGLEDLHMTLGRLLDEQHTVFEESWQRLTLAQRAVVRAVVLESGRELLSAGVRVRHRLPGASSVQSALAALVRQDIVMKDRGRYVVNDSLYREWMARRTF